MMLILKHSVKLKNLKPQTVLAINIAHSVYSYHNIDCVITSVNDSKHMNNSLHYSGNAIDVRTRNIPPVISHQLIANQIRANLTNEYAVILESDHLHVEYDPK